MTGWTYDGKRGKPAMTGTASDGTRSVGSAGAFIREFRGSPARNR
jgi:hypothetical protein